MEKRGGGQFGRPNIYLEAHSKYAQTKLSFDIGVEIMDFPRISPLREVYCMYATPEIVSSAETKGGQCCLYGEEFSWWERLCLGCVVGIAIAF